MNTDMIIKGLKVSAYGLSGVFIVLILFYLITKLMVYAFSKYAPGNEGED
mgnify:CR=1 FL=1